LCSRFIGFFSSAKLRVEHSQFAWRSRVEGLEIPNNACFVDKNATDSFVFLAWILNKWTSLWSTSNMAANAPALSV